MKESEHRIQIGFMYIKNLFAHFINGLKAFIQKDVLCLSKESIAWHTNLQHWKRFICRVAKEKSLFYSFEPELIAASESLKDGCFYNGRIRATLKLYIEVWTISSDFCMYGFTLFIYTKEFNDILTFLGSWAVRISRLVFLLNLTF